MKRILPLLLLSSLATSAAPKAPALSKEDRAELIKLYEEEIVAHDLYVALGKIHPDIRPFQNIPHSEIQHREALAAVMKDLRVQVPKKPKGQRYASEGLDAIYDQLLAAGRKSPRAACEVGVGFEELDIAELRAARKRFPSAKDTLAQLEWASGNHLRAFHRNLSSRGGSYQATHLKKRDIQSILAGNGPAGATGCGEAEQGNGPGKGQGQGRGRGQGRGNGPGRNR